jgi:uncharacterized membrane protein YbhN (UPF0104 family)
VAVLAVFTLGLLLAFRHFSGGLRRRLLDILKGLPERHFQKADRLVTAFVEGAASTRDDKTLLAIVAYTLLEWAIIAFTTYSVVRAFGPAIPFGWLDVFIFLGFISFGGVVQIPGVGGGIQVVTVLVLTELFRVPVEVSTSMAVVLWIISFVVVIPFGLILALRDGIRWSSLKQIDPEVTA